MAFSYLGVLTLGTSERNLGRAIVVDYLTDTVYVGYQTATGGRAGITKFRGVDRVRLASLDFAGPTTSSGASSAAIDLTNGRAHFTALGADGRMKLLDLASFTVGLDSFFATAAGQIVYNTSGSHVYTTAYGDSSIRYINATNLGNALTPVSLGGAVKPHAVALDSARGFVWVGRNDTSGQIHKCRTSDLAVVNTFFTGTSGYTQASPDPSLDAAFMIADGSGRLRRINFASDTISQAPGSNSYTKSVVACPLLSQVLVLANTPGRIMALDSSAMTVVDSFDYSSIITGGRVPQGMARDPVTGRLYITVNSNPGEIYAFQYLPDPSQAVPVGGGPSIKRRPYPFHPNVISSGSGTGFGMKQKTIRP